MTVILRLTPEHARLLASLVKDSDPKLSAHIAERVHLSAKSTYRRCARAECRHSINRHYPAPNAIYGYDNTGCVDCGCSGYLAKQPHRWQERVTETYRLARMAWETEAEKATKGFASELAEYREHHPAPRFRDILVDLREDAA